MHTSSSLSSSEASSESSSLSSSLLSSSELSAVKSLSPSFSSSSSSESSSRRRALIHRTHARFEELRRSHFSGWREVGVAVGHLSMWFAFTTRFCKFCLVTAVSLCRRSAKHKPRAIRRNKENPRSATKIKKKSAFLCSFTQRENGVRSFKSDRFWDTHHPAGFLSPSS